MKKECWEKAPLPLFCSNERVTGAGHCTMIVREDGISADVFFHGWSKDAKIVWNTVDFWHGELVCHQDGFCLK